MPGKLKTTTKRKKRNYDTSYPRRGLALIFNHIEYSSGQTQRHGTLKDGEDLANVLTGLEFDVRY